MTCSTTRNGTTIATVEIGGRVAERDLLRLRHELDTVLSTGVEVVIVDLVRVSESTPAIVPVLLRVGSRMSQSHATLTVRVKDGVVAHILNLVVSKKTVEVETWEAECAAAREN
ncbi:MAG: hypothetical protein WD492_14205 [Alkalispirochaeta sp.]